MVRSMPAIQVNLKGKAFARSSGDQLISKIYEGHS